MSADSFGADAPPFMTEDEIRDGIEQLSAMLASLIGTNDASEWLMNLSGEVLDLQFIKEPLQ